MLTKNHDQLAATVKDRIEAGAVVQGLYWDGMHGNFIGCLALGDNPLVLAYRFGLPVPLVRICEDIFEEITLDDAKAFFAAFPDAIGCDGKDLTRVHWAFMASELRAIPKAPDAIQAVIDMAIEGVDLLSAGREWHTAEEVSDAACDAGWSASEGEPAAAEAAQAAADCAAYPVICSSNVGDLVSHAARDAALALSGSFTDARKAIIAVRLRQRDTILRLIEQAPCR